MKPDRSMPPPQPPPFLPETKNLSTMANHNVDHVNHLQIHSPSSSTIKPTTAGLLQYPSVDTQQVNEMQHGISGRDSVSPNLMSTQKFKDELAEKQARLSSINASSSIDERMKMRKKEEAERFAAPVETNNMHQQIPEKLLHTLQGEVKPFSYSAAVNDPNNSGKLDLSEIKSPKMRRRLLANMNSNDEKDETGSESPIMVREVESVKSHTPQVAISTQALDNQCLNNKDEACQIRYFEAPKFENFAAGSTLNRYRPSTSIVHHKEPPRFYSMESKPKGQEDIQTLPDDLSSLDLEVARTLESFSLLVDNLETNHHPSQQTSQRKDDTTPKQPYANHLQCSRQNSRSTISPKASYNNSFGQPKQLSNSASPTNTLSYPSSSIYTRSMGDFLLSPDSNYFPISTGRDIYPIKPYYGSHLDECTGAPNLQTRQGLGHMGRTFRASSEKNLR